MSAKQMLTKADTKERLILLLQEYVCAGGYSEARLSRTQCKERVNVSLMKAKAFAKNAFDHIQYTGGLKQQQLTHMCIMILVFAKSKKT
jgi:hypothetical protein